MSSITVKPGDTLTGIARREGVSLEGLKEANPGLCRESSGPKRDEGCNWIYPGDEVVIPRSARERSPSVIVERAWRGISGAFTRAGRFIRDIRTKAADMMPERQATITAGTPRLLSGNHDSDVLPFENYEGLFRAFANKEISPDAVVEVPKANGVRTGIALDLIKGELKRRGVSQLWLNSDQWIGIFAQSEADHPTPTRASQPASEPRRERSTTSNELGSLTVNLDVLE